MDSQSSIWQSHSGQSKMVQDDRVVAQYKNTFDIAFMY